jgi:hypothetical protein
LVLVVFFGCNKSSIFWFCGGVGFGAFHRGKNQLNSGSSLTLAFVRGYFFGFAGCHLLA